MGKRYFVQRAGLVMVLLLLTSCGGKAFATTGTITGMALDFFRKPLLNTNDNETLIVALYCKSDDADVDCLREGFWDYVSGDTFWDYICEADNTAENCVVHLGQGAVSVETDGSYTIADVPPGEYGLCIIYKPPGNLIVECKYDLEPVQAGEITEYDISTKLQTK